MSEYGIWLSFNNQEEGFQLPINPGSIEMSDGGKGKTYEISKMGEINVIKEPKLSEYSFSGVFPAKEYPYEATELVLKPKLYVEYLLKWMESKRPIRFVFTGASFDINTPASIESFQWKEVAGGGGDIEYSLKLKKYVFYSARRFLPLLPSQKGSIPILQKEKPTRPNDKQPPKTYTLVAGDTLWSVAKKTLGDGAKWKSIQTLNQISDAEVKRLKVGRILKVPSGGGASA
ncbi:LysM peptidoglycan-binding domain-containing protein [Caldalkalibacillus mannanilyticus]|uniref:LysM peptidoglycan-binding domain-containing protein n=1 Tax=Caldalkalibacillus mannanilyticus TaxID=1418 RepID=UPI00046873AD|nr:LysM peptidoglycan-binding domain-containing protein [Caldalkalibacillus mannanilyticus]